jgi:pyruvate dehydrogenase E1 component alpha subunit
MHESMNLASAWKLPVLFVLTNNTYGMSTPLHKVVGDTDLTKRAIGYGMKAFECDGNDVLAVYATVSEARQYALENGPVLIVEHTYRTSGHSKSDGNQYRTKEEIQYWKDRNPIIRFRQQLVEAGTFTDEEFAYMKEMYKIASLQKNVARPLDWLYNATPAKWSIDGKETSFLWFDDGGADF